MRPRGKPGRSAVAWSSLLPGGVFHAKAHPDNESDHAYEQPQQRAAANQQSVAAEAVQQLRQLLPDPPFPSEEMPAPCTLPGPKVRVKARLGSLRLPDPPVGPQDAE